MEDVVILAFNAADARELRKETAKKKEIERNLIAETHLLNIKRQIIKVANDGGDSTRYYFEKAGANAAVLDQIILAVVDKITEDGFAMNEVLQTNQSNFRRPNTSQVTYEISFKDF